MMIRAVFISLLFFLSSNLWAEDKKPVLTWAFAGSSKTVNESKPNIVDERHYIFKLFKNSLQSFNQVIMSATMTRIEEEMKNKKLICYPGSSEFSRRKKFAYLTPQYIQPSPQLVVSEELGKKLLQKFNGKISLNELLDDHNLRGTLAEGRSYGEKLDKILESKTGNMKRQVFNTFIQTVVPQIKIGRVDYTLEYPFIVEELNKEQQELKVKLITIPLSDADPFVTQYTACTNVPDGLKAIKIIDQTIKKNVADKKFWKGVLTSIPASEKAAFQKHIDQFIQQRQKESVIIDDAGNN